MISKRKLQIDTDTLAQISFVLYFSSSLVRLVLNFVFGDNTFSLILAMGIIYAPLLLACVVNPRKYIKTDFVCLYIFVLLFFLITYLIHPEYADYYSRSTYGVWGYVFVPYRGIYAYWFLRLFNDPSKILKSLRIAGWLMIVYFIAELIRSWRYGYWAGGVQGQNVNAELDYSVTFGYSVLLFALLFLYCAFKTGKKSDIVGSILCIVLIFLGGSRGPVLFLGLFIVLYFLTELKMSKRRNKGIIVVIAAGVTAFIYAIYNYVLSFIYLLLSNLGVTSKFLSSLISGELFDDSGRSKIWDAAVEMIRNQPLGYGAMGSRSTLSSIIYVGYPHSVVLEILIDFGVILGTILLVIMLYQTIRLLFFNKNNEWRGLYLIFFCAACGLFISLSFWGLNTFWGCVSIGVSIHLLRKTNKAVIKSKYIPEDELQVHRDSALPSDKKNKTLTE